MEQADRARAAQSAQEAGPIESQVGRMLEHGRHIVHDLFQAFVGRDAGLDAGGRKIGEPESREDGQRLDDDSSYSFHECSFSTVFFRRGSR